MIYPDDESQDETENTEDEADEGTDVDGASADATA